MISIELEDVQSLVVRGNGQLKYASYQLLAVDDRAAAAAWLGKLADDLTNGYERPDAVGFNIAFTRAGLEAMGVDARLVSNLSREFNEGIVTPHRSALLGDVGESAPANWKWGAPGQDEIHIFFAVFAATAAEVDRNRDAQLAGSGTRIVESLNSELLPAAKEHFGFHDGISQPMMVGLKKCSPPENQIMPGEFILGYRDEYGEFPESPVAAADDPDADVLPRSWRDTSQRDFGRNGTYVVFRQLKQDVRGFWKFLDQAAHELWGDANAVANRELLAAKMIGRWPSGAPLVLSPDRDVTDRIAELEAQIKTAKDEGDAALEKSLAATVDGVRALTTAHGFGYFETDPDGEVCPFGSHLRRANPRDSLLDDDDRTPTDGSVKNKLERVAVSRHHRLQRRGRPYGKAIDGFMKPDGSLDTTRLLETEDDVERGLYFIGVNADLARQFEFVHHTWLNSGKFAGLDNDPDPLMGAGTPGGSDGTPCFTMPGTPVRTRVCDIKRWVTVRGGTYLFLPGIQCVKYIARVGARS